MLNRPRLTFDLSPTTTAGPGGPLVVTPQVEGETLVALVRGFEEASGFSPSGAYSGLIPRYFKFGNLRRYFLGHEDQQWPSPDHLWLLGCHCDEVGCWPLEARVIALHDTVTWTEFRQPNKPQWDYTGFGPFVFERTQYERVVEWMAEQIEAS